MRVTRVATVRWVRMKMAVSWVRMKMAADWGAMPAKVSVKMRPMATAGLATPVDEVK